MWFLFTGKINNAGVFLRKSLKRYFCTHFSPIWIFTHFFACSMGRNAEEIKKFPFKICNWNIFVSFIYLWLEILIFCWNFCSKKVFFWKGFMWSNDFRYEMWRGYVQKALKLFQIENFWLNYFQKIVFGILNHIAKNLKMTFF